MNEVLFTEATLHEIANANFAALLRACSDLRAVCNVVDGLDESLPTFDRSVELYERAAILRSQFTHGLAAVSALSAVASSYETLAEVASRSQGALPAEAEPVAKVAKKAKRRKA